MSDTFDATQSNPMLLNPFTANQGTVAPIQGHTPALPVKKAKEVKYYTCTLLNHHMHRKDGKRLAFVFGILKTDDFFDQQYVDAEINGGNAFIRNSTVQEIHVYNMRVDPQGTIKAQVTPEIEAKVRVELEVELRNSFEEKLNTLGIALTEEQKVALRKDLEHQPVAGLTEEVDSSAANIAGTTLLDKLRNSQGIQSGSGTVFPNPGPVLQGISGSDKGAV